MKTKHLKQLEDKKEELEKAIAKEKSIKVKKQGALKFYEFVQNNSGGSFNTDDKICHRIIIEAHNFDEAREKAMELGVYFDGASNGLDCGCCGDRWSDYDDSPINLKKYKKEGYQVSVYINEDELQARSEWKKKYSKYKIHTNPRIKDKTQSFRSIAGKIIFKNIVEYAQLEADEYGWTSPDIRIYYYDDSVKEIFKHES